MAFVASFCVDTKASAVAAGFWLTFIIVWTTGVKRGKSTITLTYVETELNITDNKELRGHSTLIPGSVLGHVFIDNHMWHVLAQLTITYCTTRPIHIYDKNYKAMYKNI